MSALDFAVDLEDIRFVLFEQLDIDSELVKLEKYAEFDHDTYDATIQEAARVAVEVLAPINAVGDRQGTKLDGEGNVTTPDGFKEAWATTAEGGWFGINASPDVGGVGMPGVLNVAVYEMFAGAAMAFWMYPGLTGAAARVIAKFFDPRAKEAIATKMYSGEWGGTMCLTESGAGSDVGANRCKATPQADGTYLLEGEKIFISGGDHDLAGNIVHLVLARTPDAPNGTKGLSLFVVPKYRFDLDTLELGERNDAVVVGIEHKMGINGSATCTLALGAKSECHGWMLGEEFRGIEYMFTMMNEARIGVGVQGVGVAAAAYHYALAYAKDRTQGSDIKEFKNADAPRVAIIQHPNVRRMLMTMKVWTETLRSMLYRLAHRLDVAENTTDKKLAEKYEGRVDLLVPILKSMGSDRAFDVAVTGVQVFGGYGYTGEYPAEQLVRDAKITSIYEGTNGIQALDLLGRKLRIKGGQLFMEWMADGHKECALGKSEGFEVEAGQIEKAINQVGATAMHLGQLGATGGLEAALLQATPFQEMMGTVHLGLEALNQARAAKRAIDRDGATTHLNGKLANLRFYVHNILPKAVAMAKAIQAGDQTCLEPGLFGE
ncbi:MAG: acyl-CoA dehydrogenase [Myxococcales bacterium]|nr:acyl-CoA dehydrogenase [Myxococcales bacterium]MCB9671189.1 acyl-CoA dehydrogenase [Alphaproteobacteria bacterium]MCB9691633.1 acyl-CoA dehydrogenase [Alphaproteobacteria bacterium]